jgi:hypothetical protein
MRAPLLALALLLPGPPGAPADEGKPPPPLPAPRFLGSRTAKDREEALRKFGGSGETEKAVELGLDWLERHAQPEGWWDADGFPARCAKDGKACDGIGKGQHGEAGPCPFDEALSAMAALALLGHGHVPDPAGDARAVLLDRTLHRLAGTEDVWGLALGTEALAEAAVADGRGRWREEVRRGAAKLLTMRGEDGGFGYAAGFRKGSDVPYTALAVPALAAARDAGVELPADLGAGVDRFLASLEIDEGRLAYLLDARASGYTPTKYNGSAAAAVREILRAGLDGERHRAHLAMLRDNKPAWVIAVRDVTLVGRPKERMRLAKFCLLEWEYGTLAMFQRGGIDWTAWYGAARTALVAHQRTGGCARGSWDPEDQYAKFVGGRILSTALGVLILEEPYRHRPR